MRSSLFICALAAASLSSGIASAQRTMPATPDAGASGNAFSFQGDQIQPMPDQRQISPRDPRYSQTYQQQQTGEIPKPGGGCLKYGAAGAVGGHLAGHGVLGAMAGCVTGAYVRHRDKGRMASLTGMLPPGPARRPGFSAFRAGAAAPAVGAVAARASMPGRAREPRSRPQDGLPHRSS